MNVTRNCGRGTRTTEKKELNLVYTPKTVGEENELNLDVCLVLLPINNVTKVCSELKARVSLDLSKLSLVICWKLFEESPERF